MPEGCNKTKIVTCLLGYIDLDGDNAINGTEWDIFVTQTACGADNLASSITGEQLIAACDVNRDGYITEANEFDTPGACMHSLALQRMVCIKCDQCDAIEAQAALPAKRSVMSRNQGRRIGEDPAAAEAAGAGAA
jgi:hypothetical protein